MKQLTKLIIIFLINISYINSAERIFDIGIYSNLNLNLETANFKGLPGIPSCCPRYEFGYGIGYDLGIISFFSVFDKFSIGARFGYDVKDAVLSKEEPISIVKDSKLVSTYFLHTINAKISTFYAEPMVIYSYNNNLLFNFGLNVGYLQNQNYSQNEKLIGSGTFLDEFGNDTKSAIRNEYSGNIPNTSKLLYDLVVGVNYKLDLNKKRNIYLIPNINFSKSINNISKGLEWGLNQISIGVILNYEYMKKTTISIKKFEIDTIRKVIEDKPIAEFIKGIEKINIEKIDSNDIEYEIEILSRIDTIFAQKIIREEILADFEIKGEDFSNIVFENPNIIIKYNLQRNIYPLLNYIFYKYNSDIVDTKFINSNIDNQTINPDSLDIYYNLLNIIKNRLTENPEMKIKLIGYNNGIKEEKNNQHLSFNRAKNLKNILTSKIGIEESRIDIQGKNLPIKPSLPIEEKEKSEENSRVEIVSENDDLLKPYVKSDTTLEFNLKKIKFYPKLNNSELIDSIRIVVSNNNIKLFNESYLNISKEIEWTIDYSSIKKNNIERDSLLAVEMIIYPKKDEKVIIKKRTISLKNIFEDKKMNKNFENYRLILFDFNKYELNNKQIAIIKEIKSKLKTNTKVIILGHTDRTGTETTNKLLAQQRADIVKQYLNHKNSVSKGVENIEQLYDNSSPEGRFYSRTVQIIIENEE